MERDISKDKKIIEMAKIDSTIQTEDIAEYYLNKCVEYEKILRKDN
ncbi:hypothetical protein [Clostridium tyrobutyricum]|nr:hypothetical protein [Clostridium tyrobutyricum]MBV4417139.1 hypothetical protein [Clostridium tyrobutyricum]MBV4429386.1 hypothetical protein [Clostridium tyrobutyricum]MBV4443013.1 hypothetical protein [Clostridium tyrobutyricum]